MNAEQKKRYDALHYESRKMLMDIVGGEVDRENPKPITVENASCIIAKVLDNGSKMLAIAHE